MKSIEIALDDNLDVRNSINTQDEARSNRGPFPPEIVDYIIDRLTHDVNTLKSCSLVCRVWSPRARFHLHKILFINSSNGVRGYIRALLDSRDIGRPVEKLSVRLSSPDDCEDFACIADYLGAVQDLTLDMYEFWVAPEIIAKLGPVTHLRIKNTVFPSFSQFKAVLAAALHVTHLTLDRVSCASRSSVVPLDLRLPIRALWLYGFDPLYNSLLQPTLPVSELKMTIKLATDLPALQSALARVGSHVQNLEIGFLGTDHPWLVTHIAEALGECTALKSLFLHFDKLTDLSWVTFPFVEARKSSPGLAWIGVGLNPSIDDTEMKMREIQQRLENEVFTSVEEPTDNGDDVA